MQTPEFSLGGPERVPRGNEREATRKQFKQELRKLMTDVRAHADEQQRPERNEKRIKELAEQIQKRQNEVLGILVQLLDPVTRQLPENLQKEIADEFNDPQSEAFINNLINGRENALSTQQTNLRREIEGQSPISPATNLVQRAEQQLSSIIDGFIETSQLPIPPAMLRQAKPFLLNAIRGVFANIAEKFAFVPGAQEFAIRTRVDAQWQPLIKLKMQNPAIAKAIRARGGPDAVKEQYIQALVGQAANKALAQQAGQPVPNETVTLESVLGMSTQTQTPPAPAAPEQVAKKEAAAEQNRPLGATAETIQDMQMSFVNNKFRVQKGADTYEATAKHGNDAANVVEVTPVRPASGAVEQLTVKTRQGTTDLTKTVRAQDIKTALDSTANPKRVTVDNVTLEFAKL